MTSHQILSCDHTDKELKQSCPCSHIRANCSLTVRCSDTDVTVWNIVITQSPIELMLSGRRYRAIDARTNRLLQFLPQSNSVSEQTQWLPVNICPQPLLFCTVRAFVILAVCCVSGRCNFIMSRYSDNKGVYLSDGDQWLCASCRACHLKASIKLMWITLGRIRLWDVLYNQLISLNPAGGWVGECYGVIVYRFCWRTLLDDLLEGLSLHSVSELQLLRHVSLPRTLQSPLRHDHLNHHQSK